MISCYQIYSAGVSVFLGGNKPSRVGNARGDISVNFSCDPGVALALVDLSLDEILRLQEEGPSDADISTVLEIEQRAHENGLQVQDDSRSDVRKTLTPSTAQLALPKILPFPCKRQYTVVVLMPQDSCFPLLKSIVTNAKIFKNFIEIIESVLEYLHGTRNFERSHSLSLLHVILINAKIGHVYPPPWFLCIISTPLSSSSPLDLPNLR
ncbi:hypothetical protein L1987_59775 [Smallanthus sonchifolius]|uniref:Uncharacterized protein n=1 Tax=Smallanthus sonchifolius TaxID=185202 RepID=A0ACB9D6E4_9ASTR|nr:hypothetical protein L1987_59775 [Smallanthus sonchifolius]